MIEHIVLPKIHFLRERWINDVLLHPGLFLGLLLLRQIAPDLASTHGSVLAPAPSLGTALSPITAFLFRIGGPVWLLDAAGLFEDLLVHLTLVNLVHDGVDLSLDIPHLLHPRAGVFALLADS